MTQRKISRAVRAVLAASVVSLAAVVPAHAATVFQAEGGGVFIGGDNTVNYLFITAPNATTIRVRSDVGTIEAGTTECTQPQPNAVECPVTVLFAEVAAEGESDIVDVDGPIATRLFGGAGDDVLRGGSVTDQLVGEGGSDQLYGRDGDDDLRGDDGNDRLDGESGSDLAIGGLGADVLDDTGVAGTDSVTYKVDSVQSGVRITVGQGANDGRDDGLDGDDVRVGFERVQGSNFNDVIRGGAAAETINGSDGNDDIEGGGGADTIEGNGGDDLIRAQDGVADARLDCDAPSDPPATNGTADVVFLDAVGTDPEPSRCETVNRPAPPEGETPPPGPPAPRNTAAPAVLGVVLIGQRNFCSAGSWTENPSFEYSWYVRDASGATRKVADGGSYVPAAADGGLSLACVVVAHASGQSSAASSRYLAVPPRVVVAAPKPVVRDFPDFTAPTKVCGSKNYCEPDEARRHLEAIKPAFPMKFKAKAVEGLRKVPFGLRAKIRPGQVFKTNPKPGADDVKTSLDDPVRVTLTYYVPNIANDCPIGETIEVKGGRDFTFNELLVGLSLRDAVKRLKAEKCTQADYEVDYRYRKRSGDPVVAKARTVDDTGKDQVRLTVDHGAPDLQLGFVATPAGEGRVPLRLGDSANEITLIKSKKQASDFTVHVGMRAGGAGFKRMRVELRDPGENLAEVAFTDDKGRARFSQANIYDDGTYELWASHTDAEGDAIVGWKQVTAKAFDKPFTGFDGTRYRYEKNRHVPGVSAKASQVGAAESATVAEMRRQAQRIRDGLLAFQHSSAGQAQANRLNDAQLNEVGSAYNGLAFFAQGTISLDDLIRTFDVRPSVATLGGPQTLGIGSAASVPVEAFATDGKTITRQAGTGVRVGQGALGFVTKSGATLFADGSYFLQSAGGNGFRNGVPIGPTVLDVTRSSVAIDTVGLATFVGLIGQDGAGLVSDNGLGLIGQDGAGVLSDNGLGLIATDGSSIISGGGGNIISGGGGNIISSDGASIISGGAGNLIGQDGGG